MKNFFLMLAALSIVPTFTVRGEWTWTQAIIGGVLVGGAISAGWYCKNKPNSTVAHDTPKNPQNQSQQDENPGDSDKGSDGDSNDNKDKDKPFEEGDAFLYTSTKGNVDGAKEFNARYLKQNLDSVKNPEPSAHKTDKNILNEQNDQKTSEKIISQKDPSFLEKLRDYTADYKELHDTHRDIFEG